MFRVLYIIVLLALCMPSCRDDDDMQNRVPQVPVNIDINILLPAYFNLQTPGGWEYVTGGSRGIIVYRNGPDEFRAFDRHCTWNVEERRQLVVGEDLLARDPECGSSFFIGEGSVVEGPAFIPLTEYNAVFNSGTNRLRITN